MKTAVALVIVTMVIIVSLFVNMAFAHPGRTNRYGCHTCRTNCERWGLNYGEYHCH